MSYTSMNKPAEASQPQTQTQPAPGADNEHRSSPPTANPDSLEHVVVLGYN